MKKDHIGMLSQRLVQFKNNKKVLNQFKNSKIVNLKTTKNAPLKKDGIGMLSQRLVQSKNNKILSTGNMI